MRVLAVGAHPDDLEILCAGTLARYKQAGHEVIMAHACNGDCGHFVIPPEELARQRAAEARAAAEILGAEVLTIPDMGDGDLRGDDVKARMAMVDIIRMARPDVIITHGPEDYMPDHVAVSELVFLPASWPQFRTGRPSGIFPIIDKVALSITWTPWPVSGLRPKSTLISPTRSISRSGCWSVTKAR